MSICIVKIAFSHLWLFQWRFPLVFVCPGATMLKFTYVIWSELCTVLYCTIQVIIVVYPVPYKNKLWWLHWSLCVNNLVGSTSPYLGGKWKQTNQRKKQHKGNHLCTVIPLKSRRSNEWPTIYISPGTVCHPSHAATQTGWVWMPPRLAKYCWRWGTRKKNQWEDNSLERNRSKSFGPLHYSLAQQEYVTWGW